MNGFRKFAVALSLALFSVSIIVVVILNSAVLTFGNPENVKTWLKEGEIYTAISKTISSQQKAVTTDNGSVDTNLPQIQDALQAALSTKFLQNTGEKVIDGLYRWLNGDVKIPDFSIDITEVKQVFAQKAAEYAKNRYESLPICPPRVVPDTSDVFSIQCRVEGYDINPEVQKIIQEITTNKDFLPSNTLTAENLNEIQGENKDNPSQKNEGINFDELKQIPTNFQRVKLANTIFMVLVLVFGALAIILSANKIRGIRRVARSLLSVGAVFTVTGLIMTWGADKVKLIKIPEGDTQALQISAQKISVLIVEDTGKITLIFGIAYLVIGLAAILIIHFTNKDKKAAEKPETKNEDDVEKLEEKEPETKNPDIKA